MAKRAQNIKDVFSRSEMEGLGLEKFERELRGPLAEAERGVVAETLAPYDVDVPTGVIDGLSSRRVLRAQSPYPGAAGEVPGRRSLDRHEAEPALVPRELNAGIVEGPGTPGAARQRGVMTRLLAPPAGEKGFAEWGMRVPSKSSLDRLPKAMNEGWEADRATFEQPLREEETLAEGTVTGAVSRDGVMSPRKDGKRQAQREQAQAEGNRPQGPAGYQEVGGGTIRFYNAEGERLHTRPLAHLPEPKKHCLKRQLQAEVEPVLQQNPGLHRVAIADGARDHGTFLDRAFPNATAVGDFYPAADPLKDALDSAYGEHSPQAQSQFDPRRRRLRDESPGVEGVTRSLRPWPKKHPRRKVLARELAYFRNHRHRMNYAEVKAQPLPMDSGVVEAACKTLVTPRLKNSGMRWRHRGGQAILPFRALLPSDRVDRAWSKLASTSVAPVRPSAVIIPFPKSPRTTTAEVAI